MPNEIQARVQLDGYFYNVIGERHGGFGHVWFLERPEGAEVGIIYDRHRAVKTFEGQDQTMVVDELSNWVMLHHPAILPLIKICRLNFRIAALMEMREGTLQDILDKGTLTWSQTETVLIQVCEALKYAYEHHQLSHLDIKPSNILIDVFPTQIQVSDWGISRLMNKGKTGSSGLGTLRYIAPERLQGKPTSGISADIFAAGMVGIYSLTGMFPYIYLDEAKAGFLQQQTLAQLLSGVYFSHANKILEPFPRAVKKVMLASVHPNPSKRYKDYEAFMSAIRRAVS